MVLYFSSTKISTGLQKGLLYIRQHFKCSLHGQTKGSSTYRLPKNLNAVIAIHYMSPLALSPPQKTNKKKKIRTEDIHRPPAGILSARSQPRRAANYRWAHHWRGTNPQHNALPNTAEIRLIPDYMYNRTHCWRTVRNPHVLAPVS